MENLISSLDSLHALKFHHIGIVVPSLKALGEDVSITFDSNQQVFLTFAQIGDIRVEFLEPVNEKSPVYNSLRKNNRLVHMCFEVDSLNLEISRLKTSGFVLISPPIEAVAFPTMKIAWLFHKSLGLIELLGGD